MRRSLAFSIALVCALASMIFHAQADVRTTREGSTLYVTIASQITDHDAREFRQITNELDYGSHSLVLYLNSIGGSVSAAIRIGRLVRQYEGTTIIPKDAKCYSSCALIFIAGVIRWNVGELGLHRPYFASTPLSREAIEREMPLLLAAIRSYTNDMNITEDFYLQVVNTEPSQMLIYNDDDAEKLVPMQDPVHEEVVTAGLARIHGANMLEMHQRMRDADDCDKGYGGLTTQWAVCREATYWGLGERAYQERYAEAKRECWVNDHERLSAAELATIAKTPRKLVPDLPVLRRLENCERNTMLGLSEPRHVGWLSWLFGQR